MLKDQVARMQGDFRRWRKIFALFLLLALLSGNWWGIHLLDQRQYRFVLVHNGNLTVNALLQELDAEQPFTDSSIPVLAEQLEARLGLLQMALPVLAEGKVAMDLLVLRNQLQRWSAGGAWSAPVHSRRVLQDLSVILGKQSALLVPSQLWMQFLLWQVVALALLLLGVFTLYRMPALAPFRRFFSEVSTESAGIARELDSEQRPSVTRSDRPQTSLQQLYLLWSMLGSLEEENELGKSYGLLLEELERITGASYSILYWVGREGKYIPLAEHLPDQFDPDEVKGRMACRKNPPHVPCQSLHAGRQWICIGLEDVRDQNHMARGCLLLQISSPKLTLQQKENLTRVAQLLSCILYSMQRVKQIARLSRSRERAVIAQELHDSLAQSLSYLKIQVTRLDSLVSAVPSEKFSYVDGVVQELRATLYLSYRQLRELITTFRLTMDGRSLEEALEDSVEEFENRSGIAFHLDNRLIGDELEPHREIQVLQIVREAITNVVQHASARRSEITLCLEEKGQAVQVLIDDDGSGILQEKSSVGKHGLQIMRQRTADLKGELHVGVSPLGGTRLQLNIPVYKQEERL